jgi:hypothetical protein
VTFPQIILKLMPLKASCPLLLWGYLSITNTLQSGKREQLSQTNHDVRFVMIDCGSNSDGNYYYYKGDGKIDVDKSQPFGRQGTGAGE